MLLECVVQQLLQSQQRDSAAGTPSQAGRLTRGRRYRPAPSSAQSLGGAGKAVSKQVCPAAAGWGGKAGAGSPSCFSEPRLPDPQRPGQPHLRPTPEPARVRPRGGEVRLGRAQPRGGPASAPGASSGARARARPHSPSAPRAPVAPRARPSSSSSDSRRCGGWPAPRGPRPMPPPRPSWRPRLLLGPRRRDKAAGAAGRGPGRPLPARAAERRAPAGSRGGGRPACALRGRSFVHSLLLSFVHLPGARGPWRHTGAEAGAGPRGA